MDSELQRLIEGTEPCAELNVRRQYGEFIVDCFSPDGVWIWNILVGPEVLMASLLSHKVTFIVEG